MANSVSLQRRPLAQEIVLLALALAFAFSTATFNATYRAQAEADAQLTNGADVTVTESPGNPVTPAAGTALSDVSGVRAVEPIQHHFASLRVHRRRPAGPLVSAETVKDFQLSPGDTVNLRLQNERIRHRILLRNVHICQHHLTAEG